MTQAAQHCTHDFSETPCNQRQQPETAHWKHSSYNVIDYSERLHWTAQSSTLMQPRRGIAQYHHRAPFIANVHIKDCSNITQFNIRPFLPTADDHDKHAGDCYEQTQAWHTLNSSLISKQCTLLRDLLIKMDLQCKTYTNQSRTVYRSHQPAPSARDPRYCRGTFVKHCRGRTLPRDSRQQHWNDQSIKTETYKLKPP